MIDYRTLQNQTGAPAMLNELLQAEFHDPKPSDALIWLGPYTPAPATMHAEKWDKAHATPMFYLEFQFQPAQRFGPFPPPGLGEIRGTNLGETDPIATIAPFVPPDILDVLLRRGNEETFVVHTPHELAYAIRHIQTRIH